MQLRNAQRAFASAVFGNVDAVIPYIRSPQDIGIYRDNVYAALTNALQAIYPVVLRLVSEDFFRYASHHYIDYHPSTSGDLNDYGERFPEFLADFPAAATLPYLPDVARLEWACHCTHGAEDESGLDVYALASIPPLRHGELKFRLNSAARLLRSSWPIATIWQVNQDTYGGDQNVDLNQGGDALLIQRVDHKILLFPLGEAEWTLLHSLDQGLPLEITLQRLAATVPDADFSALLQCFVAQGTLASFTL